jgi:hypothetical protein
MPEMNFYITDDERIELFDYVTDNDGVFVPQLHYSKPETIRIQSKAELIKYISEQKVGFYVISSRFQTEPLTFDRLGEKKDDKYYIMQRRGGPYIHFLFYCGYADDTPIKCKCTQFFHYPRYIHHDDFETYEQFPATEELKAYYKMIVKFLKSKCRQITTKDGYKYWVSKTLKEEDVVN